MHGECGETPRRVRDMCRKHCARCRGKTTQTCSRRKKRDRVWAAFPFRRASDMDLRVLSFGDDLHRRAAGPTPATPRQDSNTSRAQGCSHLFFGRPLPALPRAAARPTSIRMFEMSARERHWMRLPITGQPELAARRCTTNTASAATGTPGEATQNSLTAAHARFVTPVHAVEDGVAARLPSSMQPSRQDRLTSVSSRPSTPQATKPMACPIVAEAVPLRASPTSPGHKRVCTRARGHPPTSPSHRVILPLTDTQ